MAFPQNISEMASMGYTPTGESQCGKCGAPMAWWTTPTGKKLPYEPGTATPHFKNCGTVKPLTPRVFPSKPITREELKEMYPPAESVTITISRAGAESLLAKLQEALK